MLPVLTIGLLATGAITCTGFVHNLLRRHPACQVLLHRPPAGAGPKSAAADATAASDEVTAPAPASGSSDSLNGAGAQISHSKWACRPPCRHSQWGRSLPLPLFSREAPAPGGNVSNVRAAQPAAAAAGVGMPGHDPYDEAEPDPAEERGPGKLFVGDRELARALLPPGRLAFQEKFISCFWLVACMHIVVIVKCKFQGALVWVWHCQHFGLIVIVTMR